MEAPFLLPPRGMAQFPQSRWVAVSKLIPPPVGHCHRVGDVLITA